MKAHSHDDFHASSAKRLIRQKWDRPILESALEARNHKLSYFGLPGPNIEDLLDWRDLLGVISGVERLRPHEPEHSEDLERHRRLLVNVSVHDIPNFELLRGEIEDIIGDTLDIDGHTPARNDGKPPHRMRFIYDLVNLDYLGGIGYKERGESKQVRAVKKLFERQYGTSFVLLLTLNVRDKIGKEVTKYLEEVRNRASGELKDIINWYACRPPGEKAYKLKAVIPLFIKRTAEHNMFSSRAYPPIAYSGTGDEKMVHFAFSLTHEVGNFQAFGPQTDEQVLNLPLITVSDGGLIIAAKQHDGFDFTQCESALDFLSDPNRASILSTVPTLTREPRPA